MEKNIPYAQIDTLFLDAGNTLVSMDFDWIAAEVQARGGIVIAVTRAGDTEMLSAADEVIVVPPAPDPLSAVIGTVPLQILAYQVATLKGTDVDQPRNLAKSVTVE